MKRRQLLATALSASASSVVGLPAARAQDGGPPLRLLIGYAVGGPTDMIGRLIGGEAARLLNRSVIVENLTGASGNLATMALLKSPPDGNTLLITSLTHNVNTVLIPEQTRYDPIGDFVPVTQAVTLFQALIVAYDSPINSVADLLVKARTPGGATYGSAGIGGSSHLASTLLASRSGSNMVHVPFRGNAPAMVEVMAGRVDFMFFPMVGLQPLVQAKKLKVLAVTTAERRPDYPTVPTMAESGYPGFERYSNWIGFMAPRGTPMPVAHNLHRAIRAAMEKDKVKEQLIELGAGPVGSSPEEFAAFVADDRKRWTELVATARIKAE
ncbi:MAG: Bug family tripartite tricarboxylate transporter substrate binding protein [Lautropia sp.]